MSKFPVTTIHKYIVMQHLGEETIFVFPTSVDHDRMFEAIEAIRFDTPGKHNDWTRKYRQGEAISAGTIVNGVCQGASETMGIKSRGAVDTALLGKM